MDAPETDTDSEDAIEDAEINQQLVLEAEAYEPIRLQYENAVVGYRFEIRELRAAGADASEFPPTPVVEYFPVISSMADAGNGPAVFWLIEQASVLVEDEVELANFLRGYYSLLAEQHASGDYVKEAMERLMQSRRLLGEDFVIKTLQSIQNNSHRRGTLAMSLYLEAKTLVAREGALDPERKARAQELWRILVDGYQGTEAAKLAGSPLLDALLLDLRDAQLKWAAHVRKVIAEGGPRDSFGPLPGPEFVPLISTIAGAGQPVAERWLVRYFPAMEQATRESLGKALVHEFNWLGRVFGSTNEPWVELRFQLAEVLFEAYPDDELSFTLLTDIGKQALSADYDNMLRAVSNIAEITTDDRIRSEAQLILAQVLTRGQTAAELNRGLELFGLVKENAPDERQRDEAREKGLQFSWTMPGAVHPTLNLTDSDQIPLSTYAYRGQVIYLFFWSLDIPGCSEEIPFVNELNARYADAPVAVLGINGEMMDHRGFRKIARKLGITWRTTLLQQRVNWVAMTLSVYTYPHGVIIDDRGVIRGRGLSHEATYELIDQLVLEQQARSSGQTGDATGRVRGLARYGGSEPALPALEVTEAQIENCSRRGTPMDLADRSRLVSETGGLANVVLTVQVPNHIAGGVGEKLRVQRHDCRYEPHVLVAPQGARLEVMNGDLVPHGAGARTLHNSSFNVVLPPGQSYSADLNAVDRFQLSSDTSPWMSSWVVVTDTPFYCVSDANGEFAIPGLPPGKYKADWWHESLGTGQSVEFEITTGGTSLIELVVGAK